MNRVVMNCLLFNDHIGGHDSDKLFHDNVMKCLQSVKSHGLTPQLGTIQSWYEHPSSDLPEDRPYTFMHLSKAFIREKGIAWPQICDEKSWKGTLPKRYRVRGIPKAILVNRQGKIVSVSARGSALPRLVEEELAK